jgi:hypothetical protein
VRFGEDLERVGVQYQDAGEWMAIDLTWRSLRAETLRYRVGVHVTGVSGVILAQADYAQSVLGRHVAAGTFWRERTLINRSSLPGALNVALAVYDERSSLVADRGPRDWDRHRLLLPLARPSFSF